MAKLKKCSHEDHMKRIQAFLKPFRSLPQFKRSSREIQTIELLYWAFSNPFVKRAIKALQND